MSVVSEVVERLRALLRPGQQDRDLEEELRFHLEQEIAHRVARGEAPDAARRAALATLGSLEARKDEVRDERGVRPLTDLVGDVRYAGRALLRAPGFALSAVLVLGLAIGGAAAMFSVADAVVLSELPYPDAQRLVRIYQRNSPTNYFSLSSVDAEGIAAQAHSFSAFGVVQRGEVAMTGAGTPQTIVVGRATPGFFSALQSPVAHGRLLAAVDLDADRASVMVASHALASRIAGSADAALGRTVMLDGVAHTIVGVLPEGARELAGIRADAWPVLRAPTPTRRGPFWLRGFARLRPGATIDSATRDLDRVSRRLFPVWASSFQDRDARLVPVSLREAIVGDASRPVWLFAASVGLLLAIAVVNVTTLLLVRASARRPELAVRATLGATRQRLVRLLVAETLVLVAAAALVALAVAAVGLWGVRWLDLDVPRIDEVVLGLRTFGFVMLTSVACALVLTLSSLSAAMPATQADVARGDARRIGTSRDTQAWRALLVGAEFALAVPLLLGAGVVSASFLRLQQVNPGFNPTGLTATTIALPAARYTTPADVQRFWQQVLDRAASLPGVTATGLSTAMPPDNGGDVNNFDLLDRPVAPGAAQPVAPWTAVDGDYFAALGIDLIAGRSFTALDAGAAPPVVIVSQAWADRYYPREDPVGRQLVSGGCRACPPETIVGVVGNVKYLGLREAGDGVYYPSAQSPARYMNLLVRSAAPEHDTLRAVRAMVAALDEQLPVEGIAMTEHVSRSLADPRRWTGLLALFAATALALAATGTFGLVAYLVRQRRREIAIRMALGADARAVTALVAWSGLRQAVVGAAVGVGIAMAAGRVLAPLLFETSTFDARSYLAVALVLLVSAGLAGWLPARRAGRVAPAEILGAE